MAKNKVTRIMPIPENKPERNSRTAGLSRCSDIRARSQGDEGARRRRDLAEGREARGLKGIAVEEIVSVERNQAAIGVDDVDAGLFHGAHVESVRVEELHDEDAKDIFVAETRGSGNARQAAEQIAQGSRSGSRRMIGGEKFEEAIADSGLLFVDDGVARAGDEDFGKIGRASCRE